jgi:CelD/BcsL family acetyltransferase involved in cellulose biosynthesis
MEIKILQGHEVLTMLDSAQFQQAWRVLYEACPWATGYQSPEYVSCWYRLYEGRYRALLLHAVEPDGSLIGLLALAGRPESNEIVGAGAEDTVYQVWLALPQYSHLFMQEALSVLAQTFRRSHLHLKYLPAGTPLEGLRDGSGQASCSLPESESRPYMRTDAERITKSFNGKTNRNLFNRLKRLGNVTFEVVTAPEQVEFALAEYIRQYDFRQAAMYDFAPFRVDPVKKKFYLELLSRNMLHVSVLKAGDGIVSINIGLKGKDSVQIGIAHSPLYADYSPGRLHIYMLCMALAREGIAYFDLTPGGGYKAKLATDFDAVHELSAMSALRMLELKRRAKVRQFARNCLERFGISTTAARLALTNAKKMAKNVYSGTLGSLLSTRYRLYQAATPIGEDSASSLPLHANRIEDLLHYDDAAGSKSYHQFQYDAMKRLESRQHFYASTSDGLLVFCAWVGRRSDAQLGKEDEEHGEARKQADDAIVVYDVYRHANAASSIKLDSLLRQIARDIHRRFKPSTVELLLQAHDKASCSEAEKAGFHPVMVWKAHLEAELVGV